ncbi:MAG: histidinol phosphatase [Dehalococcoidia bacterium]|nr:histidinol phosphatase [Dehalococcoidia bacterium]MSQ16175.1 histidinol phosphatase [Dehalococcoidia bacterium]
MSNVDRLLEGSVDIHVHFGPDPKVVRRANAIAVAQQAKDMGMRGLVLKSHEYPTTPVASTVSQVVPGLALVGGVALDVEVGGLNPDAVECTARMGGRVVWMPTFSAKADRQRKGFNDGISLLDAQGRLVPAVYAILAVIKTHDMVLATGHISPQESLALVREARNQGIGRVVVTHGTTSAFWTGLTLEDMKTLADLGAYVEHCIQVMMPLTHRLKPQELVDAINFIGPERCILSTDFGQDHHPMPAEGMRMGIATLLLAGMPEVEMGLLVKDNPARLLGL